MNNYDEFIQAKVNFQKHYGHQIHQSEINPLLKPHQKDIVQWAVAGGRRAIFAAFGLGKSVMQIETLRLTLKHHGGGKGLIICPLGVRIEIKHDAAMLGVDTRFVRRTDELDGDGIYVTNYESVRDGKLDPTEFTAVTLDEASVLRSYGSKTYQEFLQLFDTVRYRYVATATPSPNRYKELIHYAGFLGIMDTGNALTRFFQRDSTKANNLTLYPHKEKEFFLWLNTWAAFVQSPADLGHDATEYTLPPNHIEFHKVDVDIATDETDRNGQGYIFRDTQMGLKESAAEKRRSINARCNKMMELIQQHRAESPGKQIMLWCDLNAEQDAIEKHLKDAGLTFSSIRGSQTPDRVEELLEQWRNKETYALIGKPIMLGSGMNLQQANTAIFLGITYKFNDIIQAVHRIHRFGQKTDTYTHLIYANTETSVVKTVQEKWHLHEELTHNMTDIIKDYGLNPKNIIEALQRDIGVERIEISGNRFTFANNDCVKETQTMEENSVDLIVTSIPFSNHYEYTPNYNDFGHTDNNEHF